MFGCDNGCNDVNGVIQAAFVVPDDEVELADGVELSAGGLQAALDLGGGVELALANTAAKLFFFGGEKDQQRVGAQPANGGSALDIDAQDDIFAAGQRLANLILRNAFIITVNAGVLKQLAASDQVFELGSGDKEVIHAGGFGGARRPVGGRNDKVKGQLALFHALQDGILTDR